tara:strand:+ start:3712 stop:4080 length:369 start_codon:yes stop_codon:yes gene_type:complete
LTWSIARLVKGGRPTLLETDKGNEVIDALNKLGKISFQAGTDDAVFYNADGIAITWAKFPTGKSFSGTAKFIDAEDVTKRYVLTVEDNMITGIATESSGWTEKTITICEDGSAVDVTFLVKS